MKQNLIINLILFASVGLFGQGFSTQTFNTAGVHSFTIPANYGTGTIQITAIGAEGGNSTALGNFGGTGANMVATFEVSAGDVLDVYVGDNGETAILGAGGGGGSAVVLNDTEVLIVAGGGAGASRRKRGHGGVASIDPGAGGGIGSGGGGGGGFNAAGTNGTNGAQGGGAGTLTSSGTGGAAQAGDHTDGGDGWGAGGGGGIGNGEGTGGGGGGYKGGDGSPNQNTAALGGESFINTNTNAGAVVSNTDGIGNASTLLEGSVVIEDLDIAPIPTMGEWALIIFALIILSLSTVYLIQWQKTKQLITQKLST